MFLMRPNKAKTAVHGCHCSGYMAVRMREVLARPWVGVRVCQLLLSVRISRCRFPPAGGTRAARTGCSRRLENVHPNLVSWFFYAYAPKWNAENHGEEKLWAIIKVTITSAKFLNFDHIEILTECFMIISTEIATIPSEREAATVVSTTRLNIFLSSLRPATQAIFCL